MWSGQCARLRGLMITMAFIENGLIMIETQVIQRTRLQISMHYVGVPENALKAIGFDKIGNSTKDLHLSISSFIFLNSQQYFFPYF